MLLSVEYGDIGQALARLSPERRAVIQALAGNVLLGFAVACVVRTRTGEPGAAAGAAVVLVLMAPSLVPQIARWVRMFPAPGTGGQSPDHVWWTVLAVCVVAIAISVGGRSLPRWISSVPGRGHPVKHAGTSAPAAPPQPPELQAAGPGRRPPARTITAALAATVLVALAGLVLTGLEWSSLATSDAAGDLGAVAGAIAYAALGALILRRAGNLMGWFMLAEGAATAVMITGSAYAIFGMKAHPGTLPAAAEVGALAEAVFVLVAIDLAALFLVFPTGRLPSPRWRPAALAGLVLTGLTLASFVVSTRRVALPAPGGISLVYPNPLAVRSLQPVAWLGTLSGLAAVFPLLLAGALVSLALRYHRGDQRLRQQMKWLGLAIAGVLATQVVGGLAIAFGQANKPLQQVPYAITPFLVLLAIPVAMAIAILRRRLFDIDVIISRALLFTLLSAGVTAVYAAIVLGIGTFAGHRSDPLLTIAAAVAIALVFQPLRQRATQLANRLVYGERATPYQVLSDFAAGMAGQLDLGDALDRMVSLLAGAAGASRVEAWIRVGTELRPSAVWPGGSAPSATVQLTAPPNCRSRTPQPGWCRSGTGTTCSARSP